MTGLEKLVRKDAIKELDLHFYVQDRSSLARAANGFIHLYGERWGALQKWGNFGSADCLDVPHECPAILLLAQVRRRCLFGRSPRYAHTARYRR